MNATLSASSSSATPVVARGCTGSLFPLGREGERRLADGEARAVAEARARDALAVHLRPVRRAEVDEPVDRALLHDLRVAAGDVRILDLDVGVARAAKDGALLVENAPLAVPAQDRDLSLNAELRKRGSLGRLRPRLVDHRRAGHGGLRCWSLLLGAATVLRHPRRDPELADAEILVGLEEDARGCQERVVLARRVLGEVLLELRHERVLVALELLAVAGGEVDRVLVRDIDARHRRRAVLVHLLRELACELDRLDVGAEGAAEDSFEDALQPLLDSPQHHYDAGEVTPSAGARSAVTAAIAQAARRSGRAAALGTAATVSTIIPAPRPAAAQRPRARACGRASATSASAQVSSRSDGCAPAARAREPATSNGSRAPATPIPSGAGPPTRGSATCRIPAASAAARTPIATASARSGADRVRAAARGRRPSAAIGASSGPTTKRRVARGSRQVTSSQPAANAE